MNSALDETRQLAARLPELLWRLKKLRITLSSKVLPAGAFKKVFYPTPDACINEIYNEIEELEQQTNYRAKCFLAQRLARKINVLVQLCQRDHQKPVEEAKSWGVESISTRQQWLQKLENEINSLKEQQQALLQQLNRFNSRKHPEAALNLQKALGDIEKQLTMAKESWQRTVG